ncbi:hypothetical protein MAPG_10303 [Magnaporthiopsis poae ATCC 64411]|uniref:Uncharacterized protein n=1 Tax=Magnaporthiopsis poae (strain ATCC 64411 / 73-15) TaxID=644358 RepID=A0A0C4EC89_MAGP6|nr:hypothetical protein MAPG_10303 [Magnaporthiopsis poae ATCC 64411]
MAGQLSNTVLDLTIRPRSLDGSMESLRRIKTQKLVRAAAGLDASGVTGPDMTIDLRLIQPRETYGEFHMDITTTHERPVVFVGKIIVCAAHCANNVNIRQIDPRIARPPSLPYMPYLGASDMLQGPSELTMLDIWVPRSKIKVHVVGPGRGNDRVRALKRRLLDFRDVIAGSTPGNDEQMLLEVWLTNEMPRLPNRVDDVNKILAMIHTAIRTNPHASQDLVGPRRDHHAQIKQLRLEESSARLEVEEAARGGAEGPEPARTHFRDAADLATGLGIAEMGEQQFRLARQKIRANVYVAAYGVPTKDGNDDDGNYDVYVLYVCSDWPDLLPRVGEQCEIDLQWNRYNKPAPVDESRLTPEAKADIISNYLCLAMDRAMHRYEAYSHGFLRYIIISFARVLNEEPTVLAEYLKGSPVEYFGLHANAYTYKYMDVVKWYVEGGRADDVRRKGVVGWARTHINGLRLPDFDCPPTFKARRVRMEGDRLPKLVDAAFLAYAPRHLETRPDGTISDTPVRFAGLPLLRDDDSWPDVLKKKEENPRFLKGRIVQPAHEPQLVASLWGINGAAAATKRKNDWGECLLGWSDRWSDFVSFRMENYMDAIPRMINSQGGSNAIEARLYKLMDALQRNQKYVLSANNHPCGLVNIRGGTTGQRQEAVAVLLVAAAVLLRQAKDKGKSDDLSRLMVVCPDAAEADKQALCLHKKPEDVDKGQYAVIRMSAGLPPHHRYTGEMDLYDEQLYLPVVGVPRRLGRVVNMASPGRVNHGVDLSLGERVLQDFATRRGDLHDLPDRTFPRLRGVEVDNRALLGARKEIADHHFNVLSRSHVIVATPTELYELRQAFPSVCMDVGVLAAMDAGKMTEAEWLVAMHACTMAKMRVMEGSVADKPASALSVRDGIISRLAPGSYQARRHLERAKAWTTQMGVSPLKRASDADAAFIDLDD